MNPLMPHQRDVVEFTKQHHKVIVSHGMRLGKTRSAITFAVEELAVPALIICPASLRWVWYEQIKQWSPNNTRTQVLETGKDTFQSGFHFYVCSYEYITKAKKIPLSLMKVLIVDEAHYLKTVDSKRTSRIWKLIDKIPYLMLLSGTIMPNRPAEIFVPLRMVGAIHTDFETYAEYYCEGHPSDWGYDATGASNIEELHQVLKPFMHHRTKEMVVANLPPTDRQVIALDLPVDKREKEFQLDKLERYEDVIAVEGLTDLLVFLGKYKAPKTIEFIENLLKQVGKVVVFFQYHTTADLLQEGLQQYGVVRYDGKTKPADRKAAVDIFQNSPQARIFLGQIKAAGVGIELNVADTTVFAEASWVPGDVLQAEARIDIVHGTPQPTFHYYMSIHKSIDEHMLRRTLEKAQVINSIIK